MQLSNSATRYGAVTKTLHWAVFALVAFQFATGLSGNVEDDLHGSIGIIILGLVAVRIVWRRLTRLPDWAPSLSSRERHVAHWTELVLYVFLIAKPLSGLLYIGADGDEVEFPGYGELPALWPESDAGEEFFAMAHAWSGYVLLAAIAVHVGLIARHTLLHRNRMAHRMLPFTRQ